MDRQEQPVCRPYVVDMDALGPLTVQVSNFIG